VDFGLKIYLPKGKDNKYDGYYNSIKSSYDLLINDQAINRGGIGIIAQIQLLIW